MALTSHVSSDNGRPAEWWRAEYPARSSARETVPQTPPGDVPAAFWSLVAFTFVLLIAPQTLIPELLLFRLALLAAGLGVIAVLVDRLLRRQPLSVLPAEVRLAAGLLVWAVFTTPLSRWPGGSVVFMADIYLKSLVIFWLLANAVTTPRRLRQLAWALSMMAIPLAMAAVQNFLEGDFIPIPGVKTVPRIFGFDAPLTQNPNDLALMLNLLLPLTVALFLSRPAPLLRVLLPVAIGLQAVAVILTFSRAGFLTLIVIGLAYLWKLRRRKRDRGWAMLAVVVGVASLPLLPAGYDARLATMTDTASDPTGSAQARRQDIYAAVSWIKGHPVIGAGIGQDTLALNAERGPRWKALHNVYLQYAVELGLPGFALFLLLFGSCLRSVARVERAAEDDPALRSLFHLAGGIQVSLIAFGVAALFHPVGYHFYFYYIAGLAVACKTASEASGSPVSEPLDRRLA
jgi:O-antigen ligase